MLKDSFKLNARFKTYCRWLKENVFKHWAILLMLSMLVPAIPHLPFKNTQTFIESTDSLFIRYVVTRDQQRENSEFKNRFTGEQSTDGEELEEVSLVIVTPEMHTKYFEQRSPLPRGPAACLIWQLADKLSERNKKSQNSDLPTVAIDFDITPIPSQQNNKVPELWRTNFPLGDKTDPAYECALAIFNSISLDNESNGAKTTEKPTQSLDSYCKTKANSGIRYCEWDTKKAMETALKKLAKHAQVTAIVYPRDTQYSNSEMRDDFLQKLCCAGPLEDTQCAIHLSSPSVFSSIHEAPNKYPLELDRTKAHSWSQKYGELQPIWPDFFPSLGVTAAALFKPKQTLNASYNYCSSIGKNDLTNMMDRLALNKYQDGNPISQYNFREIDHGLAETNILSYPIRDNQAKVLFANTMNGLSLNSSAYFLSVDTYSNEDKYVVPSSDISRLGAWLHAAVYLSEINRKEKLKIEKYVIDVAKDALFGLILIIVFAVITDKGVARYFSNFPVLYHLVVLFLPLTAIWCLIDYFLIGLYAHKFYTGSWSSPLFVILGLFFHLYTDAITHSLHGPHKPVEKIAEYDRLIAQVLWCMVIFLSLTYGGVIPEEYSNEERTSFHFFFVPGIFLVSVFYVYLCQRFTYLPIVNRKTHAKSD